ncbi:hypothetical protein HNQ56_000374 [Anaerotaenia torta]|uniref:FAD-dependent oxidoreductase n=1 Tax=Anaerotaenia torta TaxID=433293 RepID=UPI003D240141
MKPIQIHNCDVLVVGASLEGCMAAVTAGNRKKEVLLIEASGSLGQAATNGLYIHLSKQEIVDEEALKYAEHILEKSQDTKNSDKEIYHDQKLKIVLKQLLDQAGVQVLTHVFPEEPVFDGERLAGLRLNTKNGSIEARADVIIDATDKMEAGGAAGLRFEALNPRVRTNVKFNQISTEAIRNAAAKDFLMEGNGFLIGKLAYELGAALQGIQMSASDMCFCHNADYGELIVNGLTADLGEITPFALSRAQSGLRRFAYELRDDFKRRLKGFEKANIIQVAPRLDCYGLRRAAGNPYDNLILLNDGTEAYSNHRAIELGVKMGRLI